MYAKNNKSKKNVLIILVYLKKNSIIIGIQQHLLLQILNFDSFKLQPLINLIFKNFINFIRMSIIKIL